MRFVLACILIAGLRTAHAQPDRHDPPTWPDRNDPTAVTPVETPLQVLFREGRALLDAGKPVEACGKFEEAFKLDATAAGTMLNLGICNEALGKLATALKWFRRAHARAIEHDLAATEALAKQKTAELAPRVARLRVRIEHARSPSKVFVDGKQVDELELAQLELDAGRHVLTVVPRDVPQIERRVDLVDGRTETLTIEIPPPPMKTIELDPGRPQRVRAYAIGTAGIALVAGSVVLGVVGKREYERAELPADWSRWQTAVRYGGTGLFLVGAAAITWSVMLYRTAPDRQRIEVPVAPLVGRSTVGMWFSRAF